MMNKKTNVKQRMVIEEKGFERSQLFLLAIEQSSEGIAVSNLDGNLEYLNDAFAKMHGYSIEKLIGKNFSIFHTPEQMPSVEAANLELKQTGEFKGEIWHVTRDGIEFPTFMHNSLVRNNNGNPIGMVATLRDITDSKQAKKTLGESEEKYRTLVENIQDGVFVIQDFHIIFTNESFTKMFGYQPEEALGMDFRTFIAPEDLQLVENNYKRRQAGEKIPSEYEFDMLHKDGSSMSVRLNAGISLYQGKVTSTGTLKDITDRKQAEEALRKAYNELEDRVNERTKELETESRKLEEINTALRVLLTKRDEDKIYLEENVLSNVNNLILPYLNKLKNAVLDDIQKTYLEVLESNLNEIISPLARKLSSKYMDLTPAEIQVANFVKQGIPTKEIAILLNISTKTIESHRENIREKIGIKNKKVNLRSRLLSLH
jgi:PAS domain S-box-containing protein